jgi:HEPN/RES N-terminal domain 1/RES domain
VSESLRSFALVFAASAFGQDFRTLSANRFYTAYAMGDGDEFDFSSGEPAQGVFVCNDCFGDLHISNFIECQVESNKCDFCNRRSRKHPIAAPLEAVVEFMLEAINRDYEHAVEALGWDGAEGGYQGTHWDSYDLLTEEIGLDLPNDDGKLLKVLVDCLGDEPWCQNNPYALRRDQQLIYSWEHFCEFIKHEKRYFFVQHEEEEPRVLRERLSPAEFLAFISETVEKYSLVKHLSAGSLIYRARQVKRGQALIPALDFGPPPVEFALTSNRMSPAGIVMFYGSDDPATAVAEIDDNSDVGIAVGSFRTTRDAMLLDLTDLPRPLGFFESQSDASTIDRYAVQFLHDFVESMAAKVEPGRREYIDYVPTQVVTEWFRTAFTCDGARLDGIRYRSSQRENGKSVVLFADQGDVVLSEELMQRLAKQDFESNWSIRIAHENAWLELGRL